MAHNSESVIKTQNGLLQGCYENGLHVFRGIPFAQPPVGKLRFYEPLPVTPWKGIRQAVDFAPACIQRGVSMPGEPIPKTSEDCLYLNIWTPTTETDEPLPVMVWIYGGAFKNGSTAFPLYSGAELAKKGVVVVSIAYRVGPFGFLAHPELTAESPHKSSGNYGLLDQIAALKWVQENIASFGGNPNCVTIFGQSAGAIAISIQMASPLCANLFHRVIAQSGGMFEPPKIAPQFLLENAEQNGVAYAKSVGANSIEELRAIDAEKLLEGKTAAVSFPVLDRFVLPTDPYTVFAQGHQHNVPLLVGYNANEARSLINTSTLSAATFYDDITNYWGPLPKPLADAYSHDFKNDAEAVQARLKFERDLRFGWDMWTWANLHAKTGISNTYLYCFNHNPPFPANTPYEGWGASHFAELWYMFNQLKNEPWAWTQTDHNLAETMATYWTNFAKTGDPNGTNLPQWPKFNENEAFYLQERMGTGQISDIDKLRLFDKIYSALR